MATAYSPVAIFDTVMDYIDKNMCENTDTIKRNMENETGMNCYSLNHIIRSLFGITLREYINRRRTYLAAKYLVENPQKSINYVSDIFGYSEPSVFSRRMKQYYQKNPSSVKQQNKLFEDNRLTFELRDSRQNVASLECDNSEKENEYRIKNTFYDFESIICNCSDIPFDMDTCYLLAELSERLNVRIEDVVSNFSDLIVDLSSCKDYLSPKAEAAIDLGLSSERELDDICRYFDCLYFELNDIMVELYKQRKDQLNVEE